MTFWDFCAPFYDFCENFSGDTYQRMLMTVRQSIPPDCTVLEVAAGTGAISLAVADKASQILCTDVSDKMLSVARKKARKRKVTNISFAKLDIFNTGKEDNTFDVVIAGQVLHLINEPEKAAAELRRVAKNMVILPMSFTKNLRGRAKLSVDIYRLFGFAPKREFDLESYKGFLEQIGFENCKIIQIGGKIPMVVAVYGMKGGEANEKI